MSGFLAAILSLLLLGILITAVLAWQQRRHLHEVAAGVALVALLIWLAAGRSLPLAISLGNWSLQVDQIAWQLSLYALLLVFAALMLLLLPAGNDESGPEGRLALPALPAAILLLAATTLAAIWAASLPGLLTFWTLQALAWMLLLALTEPGAVAFDRLLLRGGALLFSLVFLGMAAVALGRPAASGLDMGSWPAPARIWILLAAATYLGAFPLQWWRPLKRNLPAVPAALIQSMPAVVGGSLLARLALNSPAGLGYTLFLATFGLIGLLIAVSRAWIVLGRPGAVVANLALGQASLILLVGAWAGHEAIVAATAVLVMAVGGLRLAGDSLQGRMAWLRAPAVAAIAGIPLTAGFIGLATLYSSWSASGLYLLLLVTALLCAPLVAAAIMVPWGGRSEQGRRGDLRGNWPVIAGQLLLAAGLVALPFPLAAQTSPLAWLAILLAAAGGIALSRQIERVQEIPAGLQRAFHFDLPGNRIYRHAASLGAFTGYVIRQAAAILEGEGGLLWLIVLLVVVWLAGIA